MNETTFDWDDLRLFLAVARAGGLAGASGITGKSPPTLGRRMLALERRLGRDLFHRLPRGYAITDDGEALRAKAEALESLVLPMIEADSERTAPLVKVSAGTWVTHLLSGRTQDLIGDDPVRLRFIAADQEVDIGRREALIGVRNRRPEGIGLAGRKVGRVRFAIFAKDASVETWARVLGSTPSARWVADEIGALPAVEVTSPRTALDMAIAGVTRVVLPTFIGDRIGLLTRVSGEIVELEHDQWLVTHHEDRHAPPVRAVIDRTFSILREACG